MTIGKFITVATIFFAALTFASCSKDDDDESNSNSGNREYVDLDLPSGTLWSACNIGANKPEEHGYYFAFGETKPKNEYYGVNYKLPTKFTIINDYKELLPEDDAATANWGGKWRMPSKEQVDELIKYTNRVWTVLNGVYGMKFISKFNGNTIFLPASGVVSGIDFYDVSEKGYYWLRSFGC